VEIEGWGVQEVKKWGKVFYWWVEKTKGENIWPMRSKSKHKKRERESGNRWGKRFCPPLHTSQAQKNKTSQGRVEKKATKIRGKREQASSLT